MILLQLLSGDRTYEEIMESLKEAETACSPSVLNEDLKILKEAGFITRKKRGKTRAST